MAMLEALQLRAQVVGVLSLDGGHRAAGLSRAMAIQAEGVDIVSRSRIRRT